MKLTDKKKNIAGKMHTYKKEKVSPYMLRDMRNSDRREKYFANKGKGSLEIPKSKTGKNEGNKFYEGKNEQERM